MSEAYMPPAKRQDWSTPQWLFDALDSEFGFDVDAAAADYNARCPRYWTEEEDGLAQDWTGLHVYVNPPFAAKDLDAWAQKAWAESRKLGTLVVMLVPVKADQRWWCEIATRAEVRFILGRLRFDDQPNQYPGACAVLVFSLAHGPRMTYMERSER